LDDDGDGYSITAEFSDNSGTFISLSYPYLLINALSLLRAGSYTVRITITDDNAIPVSTNYTITINIYPGVSL
jgi:hypothetical protein